MKSQKEMGSIKILIALDCTAYSKTIVEEVSLRPFPLNTKVHIVTAFERTPLLTPMGSVGVSQELYAEVDQHALKAAQNVIDKAAEILRKKNPSLNVTTVVVEGSPNNVILEEAETFGADLIVVGSNGSGVVERFILGSVSHSVALNAKCSVAIIRK